MRIPAVVKAYFDADKGRDADALDQVFATDAVVDDEDGLHAGIDEIRAWWLAAKAKYNHVADPIELTGTGDKICVRAQVTGTFPNSPATLDFLFTIQNDQIIQLKIH